MRDGRRLARLQHAASLLEPPRIVRSRLDRIVAHECDDLLVEFFVRERYHGLVIWIGGAERRASGLARDDEALVVEPETPVLLQDLRGGLEVATRADHGLEPLVLDLAHVD